MTITENFSPSGHQ